MHVARGRGRWGEWDILLFRLISGTPPTPSRSPETLHRPVPLSIRQSTISNRQSPPPPSDCVAAGLCSFVASPHSTLIGPFRPSTERPRSYWGMKALLRPIPALRGFVPEPAPTPIEGSVRSLFSAFLLSVFRRFCWCHTMTLTKKLYSQNEAICNRRSKKASLAVPSSLRGFVATCLRASVKYPVAAAPASDSFRCFGVSLRPFVPPCLSAFVPTRTRWDQPIQRRGSLGGGGGNCRTGRRPNLPASGRSNYG